MTLGQIDRLPFDEYIGWQEYFAIEPVGAMVHDYAQAHIASIMANVNRDSKKRPNPYVIDEFLLFSRQVKPEEPIILDDPEAQSNLIKQMLFGKKDGP
jgi:hypothetical protein